MAGSRATWSATDVLQFGGAADDFLARIGLDPAFIFDHCAGEKCGIVNGTDPDAGSRAGVPIPHPAAISDTNFGFGALECSIRLQWLKGGPDLD
jgi:hypothetical protein